MQRMLWSPLGVGSKSLLMSSTLFGSSLRIGSLMRVEQEPMLKAAKNPTVIAVIRKMRARIEHSMAKALKKRNLTRENW